MQRFVNIAPLLKLSVILTIICSHQAQGKAVVAMTLRGNRDAAERHNFVSVHAIDVNSKRRRLMDSSAEDEAEEDDYFAQDDGVVYDDDASYEQEMNETQQQSNNSTISNIISKLHTNIINWENNANSTAWQLYESSPSQWTTSQWDLIYSLLFWIGVMSCVCVSCCDRLCEEKVMDGEYDEEEEEDDEDNIPIERRERSPVRSTSPLSITISRSASSLWENVRNSRYGRTRRVKNSSLRNQLTHDEGDDATEIMDETQHSSSSSPSSTTGFQVGSSLVVILVMFLLMIANTLWLVIDQSLYVG